MTPTDTIAALREEVAAAEKREEHFVKLFAEQGRRIEKTENSREMRVGAHLLKTAKDLKWPDDGEGAQEFIMRRCYEQGRDDAIARAEAAEKRVTELVWQVNNMRNRTETAEKLRDEAQLAWIKTGELRDQAEARAEAAEKRVRELEAGGVDERYGQFVCEHCGGSGIAPEAKP